MKLKPVRHRTFVVNVKTLIAESELVRLGAMNSHQYAAANGAIKEKAILSGNHIERAEVGGPGEFDHMSDEELLADLRERWARFNSELQLANSNGSITFDGGLVTVPVHPHDRDPACASDDTISITDTSADSSRDVCDPVSKRPLVHAPGYTSFLSSRLWPGQHAGGVWPRGNALPKS